MKTAGPEDPRKVEGLKYVLPPILVDAINYVRLQCKAALHRDALKKIQALKDSKRSEDIFLIGNGPSIKDIDFEQLQSKNLIVCNDFYLHPLAKDLSISFYLNLDAKELWFQKIQDYMPEESLKKLRFIFSVRDQEKVGRLFSKYADQSVFLVHWGNLYRYYRNFLELHRPTLGVRNILQAQLLLSNYVGAKNAYLLGFDYSFLTKRNKSQMDHFYGQDGRSHYTHDPKYSYGRAAAYSGRTYLALEYLGQAVQTNIFNLGGEESFLDLYPFEDIQEVLGGSPQQQVASARESHV